MAGGSRADHGTTGLTVLTVTALAVLLLQLTACGRPSTDAGATPDPRGSGAPLSSDTAAASPAEDSSFTFDDIASYPSGVEVEIAGSMARAIDPGMTGAEATNGELVVVSVLIRNGSVEELDVTQTLVTASYGPEDLEAALVSDPSGALANGFLGTITPGQEDTAGYGFAIPFSALSAVTVTVDLADEVHESVSFTGSVVRER